MPVAVSVEVDKRQLAEVERLLRDTPRALPKLLVTAVNDTAKKTKTRISAAIRKKVTIKKAKIDPHIRIDKANSHRPSARIELSRTDRLSLKYFGLRALSATKAGKARGFTYKIERSGGRKKLPPSSGAFTNPRLGGHVFKRVGASRKPIVMLKGPSPWGVFVKADMAAQTEREAAEMLYKAVDRRVNLLLLRKTGVVATPKHG